MKIAHPTPQIPPRDSHGGPKGSTQAGTGDTTTAGGTTTTDPAVNVDLSAAAQSVIAAGKGNSANSPAHQARDYVTSLSGTEDPKNFGQLVSRIARGVFPGEPEPAGDETPTVGTDPVIDETGSTPPVDVGATTHEPVVIDEPIIAEEPAAEEPVIVDEPVVTDKPVVTVDEPVVTDAELIDALTTDTTEPV